MTDPKVTKGLVIPIQILFADDDTDDHFFFKIALKTLLFRTQLKTVEDGEELMAYLKNSKILPDVLFLDNNMPRKNGFECLSEIKRNSKLKELPVIVYSTYLHEDVADLMYESGAHFYIRKTTKANLKNALHHIFCMIIEKKLVRPTREEFILNPTYVSEC